MKAKLLILFLILLLPTVTAIEVYETTVNLTIDGPNQTIELFGEDEAYLKTNSNTSSSQNLKIYVYRETEFKEDFENLTESYSTLSDLLYNKIDKFNNSDAKEYYEDWVKCHFDKSDMNTTLKSITGERNSYKESSDTCTISLGSCEAARDDYQEKWEDCGVGEESDLKVCELERDNKGSQWIISGIICLIIGAVGKHFWDERQNPGKKAESPVEDTEEFDLG